MVNGQPRNYNLSPNNRIRPLSLIPIEEIVEKKKKVSEKVEELNRKPFEFKNCFVDSKLLFLKNCEGSQFELTSLSPNRRDFALFNLIKDDELKDEREGGWRREEEGKKKEEEERRKGEEGRRKEKQNTRKDDEEKKKEELGRRLEEQGVREEEEDEGGFTMAVKNLEGL